MTTGDNYMFNAKQWLDKHSGDKKLSRTFLRGKQPRQNFLQNCDILGQGLVFVGVNYLTACQCLCPGLEITGKQQDELNKWCKNNIDSQEELFALFDYDKTGTEKKWRCYSKEAVNNEDTAYDSDKQSIKYYTRNKELMELLGRCK